MANFRLTGDFETLTSIKEEGQTRVWASALYDIDRDELVHLANNIEDTMEFFKANTKKYKLEVYYHNLKFDGEFIISYLLSKGFRLDETLSDKNTFRTLITDTGLFYQMEVKFWKGKNAKKLVIKDSLKIIPMPVENMSKSFGLETLKGDIDYKAYRPLGHELTDEEKAYLINDVKIVAQSLKFMFDQGLTKMTVASNAMHSYKESIGGAKVFRKVYPLLDIEDDKFIRKAYKGGYTYVNPRRQGKILNCLGSTWDVNSLYPSQMKKQLLPFGMPIKFKGAYPNNENYPLYIIRLKCKFKLRKGFVPIIQLKNNARFVGRDTEYLSDSGTERVELTLTNVDWESIQKHYHITRLQYIDGYMFKGQVGLFDEYINYWTEIKIKATEEGNEGMRTLSKLMLNSLYGKFATNPVSDLKLPLMKDEVVSLKSKHTIKEEIKEGQRYDLDLREDKEREVCYTAMACFITAYARRVTHIAIQENYDNFIYADTDSIHILGDKAKNIEIHSSELGAWKHECNWSYGKFIRAKTYMEEVILKDGNTHLDVKCAGMPSRVKKAITKDNFKVGFTTKGLESKFQKLVPKRVKGGVILVETEFTIK